MPSSSCDRRCPTSFSNSILISVSDVIEVESKNFSLIPFTSSNSRSPDPPPVIVPNSNST